GYPAAAPGRGRIPAQRRGAHRKRNRSSRRALPDRQVMLGVRSSMAPSRAMAAVLLATLVVFAARDGSRASQSAPQTPPQVFRGGTELIELDVSVLDRERRAVKNLIPADFTVIEDGVPQKVTAVSFVDIAMHDPARSARMRFVSSDVA